MALGKYPAYVPYLLKEKLLNALGGKYIIHWYRISIERQFCVDLDREEISITVVGDGGKDEVTFVQEFVVETFPDPELITKLIILLPV